MMFATAGHIIMKAYEKITIRACGYPQKGMWDEASCHNIAAGYW